MVEEKNSTRYMSHLCDIDGFEKSKQKQEKKMNTKKKNIAQINA